MASTAETIGQIGKGGVTPQVLTQAGDALLKRELVKYRVLETCPLSPKEAALALSEPLSAEIVTVVGARIVLYRPNPENPVIEL